MMDVGKVGHTHQNGGQSTTYTEVISPQSPSLEKAHHRTIPNIPATRKCRWLTRSAMAPLHEQIHRYVVTTLKEQTHSLPYTQTVHQHTHTHTHTHTQTCTHTRVCTHTHTDIHVCTHTQTNMYVHTQTYMYVHT